MLRAVVKKELLHHFVSYRFLVAGALLVALAGLATLAGAADYGNRKAAYDKELAEREIELRRVRVYSYLQPVALRPPEPLAIFERGFEGRLANEVEIHLYSIPTVTGTTRHNPFMASFRSLDLTTLTEVVLGLLALLLTFDAVVGEAEQRNLKLVLAHGVSRATLLAGKFLGAFLALSGPLLLAVAVSLGIVLGRGGIELEREDWWRFIGLLGACAVYLGVMVLLGLVISMKSESAPRALTLAVFSWLVLVFLLPQTASAVLGEVTRDSSALESSVDRTVKERDTLLDQAKERDPLRVLRSGDWAPVVQYAANRAALLRNGSTRYYDSMSRYYREETALGMDSAERIFELRQSWVRENRRAELVATMVTALSPAFLLERIATSFANTSTDDTEAFLAACRAYREELIDFLRRKGAFSSWRWFTDDPEETRPWPTFIGFRPEEVDESNFRQLFNRFLDPEVLREVQAGFEGIDPEGQLDLAGLPRFAYRGPGLVESGRRAGLEALLLLALGGLLAAAAFRTFEHYEAE